jgi:hypothetical protein
MDNLPPVRAASACLARKKVCDVPNRSWVESAPVPRTEAPQRARWGLPSHTAATAVNQDEVRKLQTGPLLVWFAIVLLTMRQ